MSEFKKVSTKREFYVGFVDEQDKYDKLGAFRTNNYDYLGEYKAGVREGFGAFKERGIDSYVIFGQISNDSINGIGFQYSRGVTQFGYFQNGTFESGFRLINGLSFVSKKHNNYELFVSSHSEDQYTLDLCKTNSDNSLEYEHSKSIELSSGFDDCIESFLRGRNYSFYVDDVQIEKRGENNYGATDKSFSFSLDGDNWSIDNRRYQIKKKKDEVYFYIDPITLTYDDEAVTLKYRALGFDLIIKKDIFIVRTCGSDDYELEIDADFNVNYYATFGDIRIAKLEKFTYKVDDLIKYEYNENIDEELNKLIGLNRAKQQLERIIGYVVKNKDKKPNIHMAFLGNPGTGKTTFAKLIADLFYKYNVLPTNKFINGNRSTLVARYIGHTAPKTRKAVNDAMGGVLLIDEAYALADKGDKKSFGSEAIDILIQEMENRRGDFCCILAGYKREMLELFNTNPGLKSRIPFIIDFDDFTTEELEIIINKLLEENKLVINDIVKNKILSILEFMKSNPYFGNARDCRNLIEQLEMIAEDRDDFNGEITMDDISIYMKENTLFEKRITWAPMISIDRVNEYMKESPLDLKEATMDPSEAFISLVNTYDKETVVSSGLIISPDGYALTINLKPNDCISSGASRYTTDIYENTIKVFEVVSSTNNSIYSVIKLSNDGDKIPYGILEFINPDNIEEEYGVYGFIEYGQEETVIAPRGLKLKYENNEYKVIYNDDSYYYSDGALVYSKKSLKIVGLIKDKYTLIESKKFYDEILKNQVK